MEKHYTRLLAKFLDAEQNREEVLYELSLLGTRFIAAGYGPEDVVELHSDALTHLSNQETPPGERTRHSLDFLLEVMIAYGVLYRQQTEFLVEESTQRAEQRAAVALAEAEERLRQNRQRLQDRDDFVGFIAHELRRPLTTIQGRATLGERHVEGNERAQLAFRSIYEAATHMGETLDLLLALSRQERDFSLITIEPVPIATLLHEGLNELQAEQRAKHLALTVDIEPPEPLVQGDPAALRAVFGNLIANAVRYNRPGGQVMIRTRHMQEWVQIEVEDTGVGIPAGELPHIFNRYYRISQAGARSDGSGLGLALVEYIVHQHGGHVGVSSKEGEGSRFVVQLPYHQPTLPATPPTDAGAPPGIVETDR